MALPEILTEARDFIDARLEKCGMGAQSGKRPLVGIIAGSGLGGFVESVTAADAIPFDDIPGLASGKVAGHAHKWILGEAAGVPLHVIAGRRHLYEGIEAVDAVHAVRTLALLGIRLVILTNAAGGLSRKLWPGDLMLIRDHINMQFRNPLIGPNIDELGPRFPDMSEPYDLAAGAVLNRAARDEKIEMKEGVYVALLGPNYETAAEVEFLRRIEADAVGMSTVPEVIAARHAGLHVLGVSLITNSHVNKPAGAETTHEEVLDIGRQSADKFSRLMTNALPKLAQLATSPAFAK